MEYRQGKNGQSILDNNDIERTKELYLILGSSLSNSVHTRKYNFASYGIRQSNVNKINLNLDFVPEILVHKSKDILRKVNDDPKEWVLTHGDYGIHNALYTDRKTLTILDWEWSEWANPLTDIGWLCWFTKLHYPEHANLLNSLFIEEYQLNNLVQLSPEKIKAYCIYKVWKVLNKVNNAPQAVKQEWITRLKWTIETDIY
jgi:thiamine kinase-like enzyme